MAAREPDLASERAQPRSGPETNGVQRPGCSRNGPRLVERRPPARARAAAAANRARRPHVPTLLGALRADRSHEHPREARLRASLRRTRDLAAAAATPRARCCGEARLDP